MRRKRQHDEYESGPMTAQIPVVPDEQPVASQPAGPRGVDPIGVLASLLNIGELREVAWTISASTAFRIDGHLWIPGPVDQRPMTPEAARHLAERFAAHLGGEAGPAPMRAYAEGRRTVVETEGTLRGVRVGLRVTMPPAEPLSDPAPATAPVPTVAEVPAEQEQEAVA